MITPEPDIQRALELLEKIEWVSSKEHGEHYWCPSCGEFAECHEADCELVAVKALLQRLVKEPKP